MSMKYLGEKFDIHTGGEDHISVHHVNEIAQSEAATGHKVINYWLHENFLTFKGEKISKSSGGLFTVSDLQEKGFKPLVYRYFILTGSYRKPLDFSLDILKNAKNSYERLKNILSDIKDDKKINEKYLKEFTEAVNDDLDTPKALQVLWKLVRDEKAEGKIKTIEKMDEVLGLELLKREDIKINKEIQDLINKREKARKDKNWKLADEIRDKINKLGYTIDDTKDGVKVKTK